MYLSLKKGLFAATEGIRLLVFFEQLGQTEVCELQIPMQIEQNVLRLQVSIDDLVIVQVTERDAELQEVNPRLLLLDRPKVFQVGEKVAASAEFHRKHEKILLSLTKDSSTVWNI